MLHKDASGIYKTSLFTEIDGLIHGFSSRAMGDGRKPEGLKAISDAAHFDSETLIQSRQIHSADVSIVKDTDAMLVPGVDGLVTNLTSKVMLGVRTADCVPILLVDPKSRMTAAVHAGWKGTAGKIITHAVDMMVKNGAKASDIRAAIGPHIGMCCYNVDEARADIFLEKYPNDPKVISKFSDGWHLDIGWINYLQLVSSGVTAEHIDAHPTCTSCQIQDFFSYRKDTKASFGEMLGIIGWKTV